MKLKNLVGLLALLAMLNAIWIPAQAQEPTEEWVKKYSSNGSATALALDSLSNVYVTGTSQNSYGGYDYLTIKYDTSGNELWVKRYDGSWSDNVHAIALDSSGNVYVTGGSADGSGYLAYATIKYDTNGNELWVKKYSGGSATALAVDLSGNVYVTGTYYNGYATIKYDTNGNELWVKNYGGATFKEFPTAIAIAVDSSGNVYVTGVCYDQGDDISDYATIKYDTNGKELWVKRYVGGSFYDAPIRLAVDVSGNIYLTGFTYSISSGGYDYNTIKYDANGNELWVKRYDSGGWGDFAVSLVLDSAGNVYVTGNSFNRTSDYATIKYDTNGNELWVKRYSGAYMNWWSVCIGGCNPLAVDSSGNIYVTGSSSNSDGTSEYATIKYDANGNELWVKKYSGGSANALAVDLSGNVYVTGSSSIYDRHGDWVSAWTTIKYSQMQLPRYDACSLPDVIRSIGIENKGIENSLVSLAENACRQTTDGKAIPGKNMLEALTKEALSQKGKNIDSISADKLINYVNNVIAGL